MDLILSSFDIFLRWDVWAAILVGSIGGVIIGAIPGVGPAVAIAILLPATYSMEPIIGITCLLYTSPSPRDKRQTRMPSSA